MYYVDRSSGLPSNGPVCDILQKKMDDFGLCGRRSFRCNGRQEMEIVDIWVGVGFDERV